MKLSKNFTIPLIIILVMSIIMIAFRTTPAVPIISLILFVLLPIFIIQQKTRNNWGMMFIFGIVLTIVYIAVLIGVFSLANNYEWLKEILLWPTV